MIKLTKKQLTIPCLLKKVQTVFNRYIRERDKDKGCVSCRAGVEHASHFYSAGGYSALRFTEDNVHGSCLRCNYFLSGNLIHYRQTLVTRIGQQRLNILDSTATRSRFKKWDRYELEIIYKMYKQKLTML